MIVMYNVSNIGSCVIGAVYVQSLAESDYTALSSASECSNTLRNGASFLCCITDLSPNSITPTSPKLPRDTCYGEVAEEVGDLSRESRRH